MMMTITNDRISPLTDRVPLTGFKTLLGFEKRSSDAVETRRAPSLQCRGGFFTRLTRFAGFTGFTGFMRRFAVGARRALPLQRRCGGEDVIRSLKSLKTLKTLKTLKSLTATFGVASRYGGLMGFQTLTGVKTLLGGAKRSSDGYARITNPRERRQGSEI
jgi:hypothetical protein